MTKKGRKEKRIISKAFLGFMDSTDGKLATDKNLKR